MKKLLFSFLFLSGICHAQDIVKLTNGLELDVKILSNNAETISFERGNLGIPYFIVKNEINEIKFANGTVEKVAHPEMSLEDLKGKVIALLNENGLDANEQKKLRASFEDNKLRLVTLDKDAEAANGGILYDFRKVIRFDEVSYRRDNIAFVNVWTTFLKNKEKNEWEKIKFVVRVDNYEKATLLADALKQLNKALKQQ
ncbi:MAG TPA: hypothetical protein VK528_01900 [Flavobacterium sp.]|nr:hypothetical protein [Flavobacterium sp.]